MDFNGTLKNCDSQLFSKFLTLREYSKLLVNAVLVCIPWDRWRELRIEQRNKKIIHKFRSADTFFNESLNIYAFLLLFKSMQLNLIRKSRCHSVLPMKKIIIRRKIVTHHAHSYQNVVAKTKYKNSLKQIKTVYGTPSYSICDSFGIQSRAVQLKTNHAIV